jgi:hypothetical protein
MTFQERLALALDLLEASGMRRSNYAPPLYRLLWRLGVPLKPAPFASFLVNFTIFGILFGVMYGLAMWFLLWRNQGMSTVSALISAIFAGIVFGAVMAGYWVYKARRLKLPPWDELRPQSAVFD